MTRREQRRPRTGKVTAARGVAPTAPRRRHVLQGHAGVKARAEVRSGAAVSGSTAPWRALLWLPLLADGGHCTGLCAAAAASQSGRRFLVLRFYQTIKLGTRERFRMKLFR